MGENLTPVELTSISLHEPKLRTLTRDPDFNIIQEDEVCTPLGPLHVAVQGKIGKPAIVTYHDIGLNSTTCFQGFFCHSAMRPILQHFCVYHVNAPGQQESFTTRSINLDYEFSHHAESDQLLSTAGLESTTESASLPLQKPSSKRLSNNFPSMDHLGAMLADVVHFYKLTRVIGFGVGAGANVLARYALMYPDKVEALVLLNCSATKAGWTEWGFQKLNSWHLRSGTISQSVEEYLLWHWFGSKTLARNSDLVNVYSEYIKSINPANLAQFIESYIKRTDLGIIRETDPMKKDKVRQLKCPVMLVAGEHSPHLNDVVTMNGRLDPANSNFIKFNCGGMVLEESPDKLCESFRLFLQGMGYVITVKSTIPKSIYMNPAISADSEVAC